jgi:hypothetical protein
VGYFAGLDESSESTVSPPWELSEFTRLTSGVHSRRSEVSGQGRRGRLEVV